MTGHGGNIYRFAETSGIPERNIIDFSASINPLGVSKAVQIGIQRSVKSLPNYPDPDAKELALNLSRFCDVNPESIICSNGSTELIYLIARSLQPRSILVTEPTFSEYERACRVSSKSKVKSYRLKKESNFDIDPGGFIKAMKNMVNSSGRMKVLDYAIPLAKGGHQSAVASMAFICNPNNPTGRVINEADMLKIADAARSLRCCLVVDEAFIDFLPEYSIIKEVDKNPYLIVIRSMTKFYAFSGLRLGYGVFPLRLVRLLQKIKEPWTVNTLAQRAGVIALNDLVYREKTFTVVRKEKQFMEKWFKKLGIYYLPSSANYYLIRLNNASEVIQSLRNKGILVRDCSNFIGLDRSYIRVAVKSRRENLKLLRELTNSCTE